ncbi:MAG: LysR family transcriptional regulator [Polyangiaceae bacterium]
MDTEGLDVGLFQAFAAVARNRSLTSAAKTLGVSQPTLTRRLQALEGALGATLVVRTPTGIHLTEAGLALVPPAMKLLATVDEARASVSGSATDLGGAVSVGSGGSVGAHVLPDLLARFLRAHPGVSVRIREGMPETLEHDLARGELDLAVITLPVHRKDLVIQKVYREDYVLAVPSDHPLAEATSPVKIASLADEPLLVVPISVMTRVALEAMEARGKKPRIVATADNFITLRRMVARGAGVAFCPRLMTLGAVAGVRYVELEHGGTERLVAVAHHGSSTLSRAATALRDAIVTGFGERAKAKR